MHRLRLRLPDALKLLNSNKAACAALMNHIDSCEVCQESGDICEDGKPFQEEFKRARMLSRLYFGKDPDPSISV